jgi:hypothetical protein
MTPNASNPTSAHTKAANIPMSRPTREELEYDSEAETLVGDESDDDTVYHPRPSAQGQPAAGNKAARWLGADEPCAPTLRNIDAAIRAREVRDAEVAAQRSDSLILGAKGKDEKLGSKRKSD